MSFLRGPHAQVLSFGQLKITLSERGQSPLYIKLLAYRFSPHLLISAYNLHLECYENFPPIIDIWTLWKIACNAKHPLLANPSFWLLTDCELSFFFRNTNHVHTSSRKNKPYKKIIYVLLQYDSIKSPKMAALYGQLQVQKHALVITSAGPQSPKKLIGKTFQLASGYSLSRS